MNGPYISLSVRTTCTFELAKAAVGEFFHSLTGTLDRRRVVGPSRLDDHWPRPKHSIRSDPDVNLQLADHSTYVQIYYSRYILVCLVCRGRPRGRFQSGLSLPYLTLPYLTFGVGRLLHLPSAEAVSVRPNAQPRCNRKVTVIGCEAEHITSHLGLVTCSMVVPIGRSALS